jgi:hypothetical protein
MAPPLFQCQIELPVFNLGCIKLNCEALSVAVAKSTTWLPYVIRILEGL